MWISVKNIKNIGIFSLLITLSFSCFASNVNESEKMNQVNINNNTVDWTKLLKKLNNSHDLVTLPDWGPYTKKYIGTTHIDSIKKGTRFDLSVFPSFYRRRVDVPNVNFETEYYPWDASSNLNYYKFRHMMEWKNKVYADISYYLMDKDSQAIEIDLENKTKIPQTLAVHFMASMSFPAIDKEINANHVLYPAKVSLKNNAAWFDAGDYSILTSPMKRPTDTLVKDGQIKGEKRVQNFVNGSGIEFGSSPNDKMTFDINLKNDFTNAVLLLRYKMEKGNQNITVKVDDKEIKNISIEAGKEIKTVKISIAELTKGKHSIEFITNKNGIVQFDGFGICDNNTTDDISFSKINWKYEPEHIYRPSDDSIVFKYKDADKYYAVKWFFTDYMIREFYCRDLDVIFKVMANNHTKTKLYGDGKGHYTNIYLRPIAMKPESSRKIYAAVLCTDTLQQAKEKLNKITEQSLKDSVNQLSRRIENKDKSEYDKAGEKYQLSQTIMKAILLTNVVFPVYTQKHYIRHSTPGKYWDSLYTWDSGFIGLGLLEYSVKRAIENLNVYMTQPGSQSAFIHHGSPVPVQHYLFFEIWNRTQSKELLKYFYPRLKQYYEFLAGKYGSSTTAKFKSGLLQTWDYFYNSGGWDDYPPQKYVDEHNAKNITPVITTAQVIRCAKFLIMYADILGLEADKRSYEADVKKFTEALNKYSWDKKSGYFSYVVHDKEGNPTGIFKTESGENFNKGMDGLYPLVAGICPESQAEILIKHLESPKELWSKVGLSTVSQSASYYRKDGYWNGTVWMPHQWFFWKTMLDYGRYEFAEKIAKTALNIWKFEVDSTYRTFEHFVIEGGRGAGWFSFGGLSAPVVSWYAAYYKPGTINTGFDTIILNEKFNGDFSKLKLTVKGYGAKISDILVCMNPNFRYKLAEKQKDCSLINRENGNIVIKINNTKAGNIFNLHIVKQ